MDLRDLLTPRALLVSLLAVLVVILVLAASTSSAAFGIFNPSWDGVSGVQSTADRAGVETTVALSTTAYSDADPNRTVAFVIAPTDDYTPAELDRIRAFVRAGGTLVVAEDFGAGGNQVLRGVGAETRFDGRLLRDHEAKGPTTAMPITRVVANESRYGGAETVMLNHGTVLRPSNATVVARSSNVSYLDTDRDAEIDDGEQLRPYPVVATESVGSGRVVAVSDASLFINAMLERASNEAFTRSLVAGNDLVILDGTHAETHPPLRVAVVSLRSSPILQALAVLILGFGAYGVAQVWSPDR